MERSGNVTQLDRVRCLECGVTYAKRADGGTADEDPGCPKCGYVGWISTTIPVGSMGDGPRRFDAGRPRSPAARSR
jgi:hypothetical protein